MNALEMKTLMTMPEDTLVPWGDHGKVITVAEALSRVLKGEGMEVSPVAPAPGQPGDPAGPNIRISQEAINALSETQYQELKETGHLRGVTNSDNGRAYVHVSRGGSISIQRSFNPETGAIEAGRGLDMRDFHDPAAETKWPSKLKTPSPTFKVDFRPRPVTPSTSSPPTPMSCHS